MAATMKRVEQVVVVHEDEPQEDESTEEEMDFEESRLDESNATVSDESEEEVDGAVLDDIQAFESTFQSITKRFRILNRIGEGTFSTVYKAEDLHYDQYKNEWDLEADEETQNSLSSTKQPSRTRRPHFVAIKKIYVTSSPSRIHNELQLLHRLRDSPNVCPLITAYRHQDQVIAVLPFFQHKDFRDYYREFSVSDMRIYFHSLFTAIHSVHQAKIIHRDIKPTNFLYSPAQQRGVLVDFGLAEWEGTDYHQCNCVLDPADRQRRYLASVYYATESAAKAAGQQGSRPMYPKDDPRSSRRANRAGTRGFRAPEVLLKCTAQSCQIDIWSIGIILLTFLSKRFPFFHSADDIDAFIELCTIFGSKRMKEVSVLHGQIMDTNIPSIHENGHSWEKILLWCTNRSKKNADSSLTEEELEAIDFMRDCLELDPNQRITARQALSHPWLLIDESAPNSDDSAMDA